MKKTFRVQGYGNIRFTIDDCEKRINAQKKQIEELKWDLENWYDVPEWRTREKIRACERCIKQWESVYQWALERGYDKELEEA